MPDTKTTVTQAPSQRDRFVRNISEAVGGPLGTHARPGVVAVRFFTVQRVLVVMTVVSALVALMLKQHCRTAGWNSPDEFTTMCFSQVPHDLAPAADPGSAAFAPVVKLIASLTAAIATASGASLREQQLTFFDANAVLMILAWVATVLVVSFSVRKNPWSGAVIAASPLLVFTGLSGWYIWGCLASALSIWLYYRRRLYAGALCSGIAVATNPMLFVIPLALCVLLLGHRRRRQAVFTAGITVAAWIIVNLPLMVLQPGSWARYFGQFFTSAPTEGSVFGAVNAAAQRLGVAGFTPSDAAFASLGITVIGLAVITMLWLRSTRLPSLALLSATMLAWVLLCNSQTTVASYVLLLPLLALVSTGWLSLVLWQIMCVVGYCGTLLQLGMTHGDGVAAHGIDIPFFLLALTLAGASTVGIIAVATARFFRPPAGVPF